MNKQEMNSYLESIGGLVRTWRVDKGPILDAGFFELDEGWYPMIKELIGKLIELGWDRKIYQVKEKLGGLRFYAMDVPENGDALIAKYESQSYKVCEKCGNAGVVREGDWYKTLCDEHSDGRLPSSARFIKL
jgi:hypothetical protein